MATDLPQRSRDTLDSIVARRRCVAPARLRAVVRFLEASLPKLQHKRSEVTLKLLAKRAEYARRQVTRGRLSDAEALQLTCASADATTFSCDASLELHAKQQKVLREAEQALVDVSSAERQVIAAHGSLLACCNGAAVNLDQLRVLGAMLSSTLKLRVRDLLARTDVVGAKRKQGWENPAVFAAEAICRSPMSSAVTLARHCSETQLPAAAPQHNPLVTWKPLASQCYDTVLRIWSFLGWSWSPAAGEAAFRSMMAVETAVEFLRVSATHLLLFNFRCLDGPDKRPVSISRLPIRTIGPLEQKPLVADVGMQVQAALDTRGDGATVSILSSDGAYELVRNDLGSQESACVDLSAAADEYADSDETQRRVSRPGSESRPTTIRQLGDEVIASAKAHFETTKAACMSSAPPAFLRPLLTEIGAVDRIRADGSVPATLAAAVALLADFVHHCNPPDIPTVPLLAEWRLRRPQRCNRSVAIGGGCGGGGVEGDNGGGADDANVGGGGGGPGAGGGGGGDGAGGIGAAATATGAGAGAGADVGGGVKSWKHPATSSFDLCTVCGSELQKTDGIVSNGCPKLHPRGHKYAGHPIKSHLVNNR